MFAHKMLFIIIWLLHYLHFSELSSAAMVHNSKRNSVKPFETDDAASVSANIDILFVYHYKSQALSVLDFTATAKQNLNFSKFN